MAMLPPPPVRNLMNETDPNSPNKVSAVWSRWYDLLQNQVNLNSSDFAPSSAQYVLTVPNVNLPGSQSLADLPSGFLKVTTASGVLSSTGNNLIQTSDIQDSGVNPGAYGDSTNVSQFVVGIDGRITSAGNVTISGTSPGGTAGGDLSGTYPNPTVSQINGVALGSTTATTKNILIADGTQWVTRAASGDLTISANTGTFTLATVNSNVGSYGSASKSPTVTVNAKGLVTAASETNIAISESQVTNLTTDLAAKLNLSGGTMVGNLILNADPTVALGAVTKQYADAIASGIDFKQACYAATTTNLSATYLNGVAGIGATLVNAGALAAFSVDGQSPALNARILVKNQSSTFQNGIYVLSTVGSGAIAWVLTRATDYDQTTEIFPGTLVPVDNGTVNALTSWVETATVTTIGTDPITFSEFSASPSTFLQVANNLSDVANASTSRTNLGVAIGTNVQAFSATLSAVAAGTYTGASSITTLGTIGTGTWNGSVIGLTYGGTGANLTASNGGIVYSGSSALAILAGTATASKMLLSGSSTTPTWSTSTIPTSAGATANKILLSDGTNYVLSTPTFPNASATSGKIIKSDGTNWTASTETYAAPGTSGNVMVSDGTNWTSASGVTTATNATNTAITDDTTTNAAVFPTWVTTNTGNLPQKVSSSKMSFNPSTGRLDCTAFAGVISACTSTSMVMVTPLLGTPTSGVLTNCTGYTDANLSTSDITTNDVSITKHGFAPKAPNDATKFLNGTGAYSIPSGTGTSVVVQQVRTQTGAVATGTTLIPQDDTIPQSTEGDQYMSLAITPSSSSTKLVIEVNCLCSSSVATYLQGALFQDSTANALAATAVYQGVGTGNSVVCFTYQMTSGTTSATTFKVRLGGANAGTLTFNGAGGGRKYGGVAASTMTITEYTS